jgi:adenylate kinase
MIAEQPLSRKTPNILVTGTPGTGKTTFCQLLNQSLNFTYLPIGKLIIDHALYDNWNKEFDVPEFSEEKLLEYLSTHYDIAAGGLLFDFHSADIFPQDYFDLIILMRCENETLYKRLEERGYKQEKITENIECEIFEEVKLDIEEHYNNPDLLLELRNEKQTDMEANLQAAINWLLAYKQTHAPL